MALEVNDLGRLALGGQMGPEIGQVEGRLVSKQSDEYLIAVRSVKLIRGGSQIWNGEKVTIKREYISQTYERRLSTSRTVALSAVFVVGVYALVERLNLFGFGKEGDTATPPESVTTFRPPRP